MYASKHLSELKANPAERSIMATTTYLKARTHSQLIGTMRLLPTGIIKGYIQLQANPQKKKIYVPKHHSELKANKAQAASWQKPAEGPTIVVDDDDPVEPDCCGLSSFVPRVWRLPFPQNKVLTVDSAGFSLKVIFVPVINLPLSANQYYVVSAEGDHKGQVYTCSSEENMTTCCFGRVIKDVKPKPFDHRDIYQQIEIIPRKGGRGQFTAKSVAPDGFPPDILRNIGLFCSIGNQRINLERKSLFCINQNP